MFDCYKYGWIACYMKEIVPRNEAIAIKLCHAPKILTNPIYEPQLDVFKNNPRFE
jgi:hypothetical protein